MWSTLNRRRPRPRPCGWHGDHHGQASVGVTVGWPCGHTAGRATPTCSAHLNHLLSQGGRADRAVQCPVCGSPGAATVVDTADGDPTDTPELGVMPSDRELRQVRRAHRRREF
uniref:Uncharacterized protein n=1 Tax=Mycolicibacterium sp. CBMA 213 TaxID=1968788 RepID=A0A343VR85_9MYCO|nr:hypothetical protein B5P44_p00114 [Mycolicibacterium sp. CBMA 213]